jgi:hypothetical protein
MNWKVGLFRLWALCSAVWIIFAFFIVNPVQKFREITANDLGPNLQFMQFVITKSDASLMSDKELLAQLGQYGLGPLDPYAKFAYALPTQLQRDYSALKQKPFDQLRLISKSPEIKVPAGVNPFDKFDPINVEMPDGTIIQGVPGDATQSLLSAMYPDHLGWKFLFRTKVFLSAIFASLSAWGKIALLPPLIFLAFGYAGLWVVRGFKS